MKLSDYIWDWLTTYKKNSVRASTYERLEESFKSVKTFPISEMDVDAIRPKDLQTYINQLVEFGYAASTIKKQTFIVTAPLKFAAANREIQSDPTYGIRQPPEQVVRTKQKDVHAYTQNEQIMLKNILSKSVNITARLIEVLLETGLRIGECLALNWDDINWHNKSINVRKTVINPSSVHRSYVQNGAKTRTSNRTIPMSRRCIEILTKLSTSSTSPSIFTDVNNRRISYNNVVKHTRVFCSRAGIEYKGLHVFRHTFATNCYYKGCDIKVLSKLLGHASTAITYSIYVNLYGDSLEEMRSILD